MKKTLLVLAAFGLGLGMSSMAMAATESGTMTTTATLVNACTVSDASMAFGSFAALVGTGDKIATSVNLKVACTTDTVPVIWSDTARTLSSGGNSFDFNLSQTAGAETDSLAATLEGETIALPWTADGIANAVNLYGRIPAINFGSMPMGAYTADIIVKVDY